MIHSFLHALKPLLVSFDKPSQQQISTLLKQLSKHNRFTVMQIQRYTECLLFLQAYASSKAIYAYAELELLRLGKVLKNNTELIKQLQDSGYPHTFMYTRFSHEAMQWIHEQTDWLLALDGVEDGQPIAPVLARSFSSIEKHQLVEKWNNEEIFEYFLLKKDQRLPVLLSEFTRWQAMPSTKDYFWDKAALFFKIGFRDSRFVFGRNKLSWIKPYLHQDLIKKFDVLQLLQTPLPDVEVLSAKRKSELVHVIKASMVLAFRETDTSTFMKEDSLQYISLDRGIGIAFYDMLPERQLPLQSYIGFTMFKNGHPVSYGGSWIFGDWSQFGINILESFRGGESGYLMCQLLRAYIQTYSLQVVEVDAYQFGKDNEDGIRSGAFWFYYKFGFRPMDTKLNAYARMEFQKIKNKQGYKSSEATLRKLAESNMSLVLKPSGLPKLQVLFDQVTQHISAAFHGNRRMAEKVSVEKLEKLLPPGTRSSTHDAAFLEWALLGNALGRLTKSNAPLLERLVRLKANDSVAYQAAVLEFFRSNRKPRS